MTSLKLDNEHIAYEIYSVVHTRGSQTFTDLGSLSPFLIDFAAGKVTN